MRKFLISIIFLIGSVGLFGQQNTFKYVVRANGGLQVGGSTLVKIDSITSALGNIYFWSGASLLSAVPGGGSATWGAISGSLASQIDLTNALNLKANLISPTFTGTPVVPGYVPTSTTVNAKALTGNISLTASDVGALGASDTTAMLSKYARKYSPIFTGTPTVPGYVSTSTSVNGHALSGNVSVTASDVGLGNVTNESKTTMFTSPAFTGIVKNDPSDTLATKAYARSVGGGSGSMIYPGTGIPLSTGSAWGTSITNNSTNWNSAYTWTNTNGANAVTAYGWGNHATAGYVPTSRTVNGHALTGNVTVTASDVSLGNVTNESKATMFTSPTFTGTVSGISSSMVGLGNVTNESKSTMFSSPTFTGTPLAPTATPGTNTTQIATTAFVAAYTSEVRNIVSDSVSLKLNINNGTTTGTLTTAALNVGGKDLSVDSISYVDGKYALWDGADTVGPLLLETQQVELSSLAVMLADTSDMLDPYALTSELGGAGLTSGQVATQINDTIVARLAAAVDGVRLADSSVVDQGYVTPTKRGNLGVYFIAANDATTIEKGIANVVCDGTADQVQINAALTAGYNIKLSSGTFNLAGVITASVNDVIINGTGDKTIINLSNSANSNIITVGGDDWIIKDFVINGNDANNTGTCYGIHIYRRENILIENLEIFAVEDNVINLRDSANNVTVRDSYIHDCAGSGVFGIRGGDYAGEVGEGPYNVLIDNCAFHNLGTAAVGCYNTTTASYVPHNWNVINSRITGYVGYMGIYYLNGYSLNVYNTFFELDSAGGIAAPACIRYTSNVSSGIVDGNTFRGGGFDAHANISIIDAHGITVSNNYFTNSSTRRGHGIHIEAYDLDGVTFDAYDINITGNTFYNIGNNDDEHAIVLYSVTPYTVDRVNITNNIFTDDRGAGALCHTAIFVNSDGCNNINITGNTAEGLLENFFRITGGSSGINNFILSNNLIIDIPTAVLADIGSNLQITNNKFVSCTTPIDVNDSDVTRPFISENSMYGCSNSGTYSGATGEVIGNNLWHDGSYGNVTP